MFDLIDPNHNGRSAGRSWPYVARSACASIGSPNVVPVPCPSTRSTSSALNRALANAARITRCCEGPLGVASPLEAPSWLTADPRTTANTGCPNRCASANRSSTSAPAPSENPVPSAAPAYALHRPSAESARCRLNSMNIAGVAITVTPPASAKSHSPDRNDCAAKCNATNDDEHAVSTDTAGPSKPSTYATRPDATLNVEPRSP